MKFQKNLIRLTINFRKDGEVYHYQKNRVPKKMLFRGEGSIKNYAAYIQELQDYIVTTSKDSVYGEIQGYNGRVGRFRDKVDQKVKYKDEEISALRYNSRIYRFKKKPLAGYGDDKDYFLLVLVEGEVNLYAHHYGDAFKTTRFYYVEKGDKLMKIPVSGYGFIMDEIILRCSLFAGKAAE